MDLVGFLFGKRNDPVSLAIEEALNLLEERRFDEALAVIREKALAREPRNRRALLHLGVCHMLKGEFDEAEEILNPIASLKPMDSEVAAARIALDKIAADRRKMNGQ